MCRLRRAGAEFPGQPGFDAVVWQAGSYRQQAGLPGAYDSTVSAINANGQTAGSVGFPDADRSPYGVAPRALTWDAQGAARKLPTVFGTEYSFAQGIDDHGLVVGTMVTGKVSMPTLWTNQSITILPAVYGDAMAGGAGVVDINEGGDIVADGFNVNTQEFQAFLITTSVLEPRTWALMALGLGGLVWRRRAAFGVQYADGQPTRR